MHIAIEGLDGVGKTTTAKALSEKIGFHFIEKPLHYLMTNGDDGMETYMRIMEKVNNETDLFFRSLYYSAGNCFTANIAKKINIVTDRHIASTYFWNHISGKNDNLFDMLINYCGKPDFTFILFAEQSVRQTRIHKRNPNDPDLKNKSFSDNEYDKLIDFVRYYDMPFFFLDTSQLSQEEVISQMLYVLKNEGLI